MPAHGDRWGRWGGKGGEGGEEKGREDIDIEKQNCSLSPVPMA